MEHLNSHLRRTPLFSLNPILPEIYNATTLDDFVKNSSSIIPTRKILPPALFYYGKALLHFDSSVIYHRLNASTAELSDLTATVEVNMMDHSFYGPEQRSQLQDGARLYHLSLVYHPQRQCLLLVDFKMHGPAAHDRNMEKETREERKLAWA